MSIHPAATAPRDLRIDFFRGLALLFIFWDHIPGNPFASVTLRNLGFSDAAEVFVFLAGYGAALAYGGRYLRAGYMAAALRLLRRVWVLYIAHIFLLAQLMAVIFVTNDQVATRDFVSEMGLHYFVDDPQRTLVDGMLLRFKPGLMDPLPLYIVLLLALVAALPALLQRPLGLLTLSGLIYLAARLNGWNFSAQPYGVWYFNPLTWQFLFFLGAAAGAHRGVLAGALDALAPRQRRSLLAVALLYLALAALLALSWNWPQWHDAWIPPTLAQWLYPIDKTSLAPLRLLHFCALALCAVLLLPQGRWLDTPVAAALRCMGRHSLEVFCLGVLLAPLADGLGALAGDSLAVQALVALAGGAALWQLACLIEWYQNYQRRSAAAPPAGYVDTAAPRQQPQ